MKHPFGVLGLLAATAILSACAGGPSASAVPYGASASNISQSRILPDKCAHNHGVYVRPCRVTLTVSNPTAKVTANGPSGTTFVVRDTRCASRNIATVAGVGNTYTVTAGTSSGTCQAKFIGKNNKQTVGTVEVFIQNQI